MIEYHAVQNVIDLLKPVRYLEATLIQKLGSKVGIVLIIKMFSRNGLEDRIMPQSHFDEADIAGADKKLYTLYIGKVFHNSHLRANSDYSTPSTHRPEIPSGQAKENKDKYLDPWFEVCLNCNLKECCRDGCRDSDTKFNRFDDTDNLLSEQKKLCPIEIAKKIGWKPDKALEELIIK